jgi:hypothetical protein
LSDGLVIFPRYWLTSNWINLNVSCAVKRNMIYIGDTLTFKA